MSEGEHFPSSCSLSDSRGRRGKEKNSELNGTLPPSHERMTLFQDRLSSLTYPQQGIRASFWFGMIEIASSKKDMQAGARWLIEWRGIRSGISSSTSKTQENFSFAWAPAHLLDLRPSTSKRYRRQFRNDGLYVIYSNKLYRDLTRSLVHFLNECQDRAWECNCLHGGQLHGSPEINPSRLILS